MNNCRAKRLISPYGSWKPEELIGARVRVRSLPVSNFIYNFDADQLFTISNIYIRISMDGKAITVIELDESPGHVFTWKDLEIESILVKKKEDGDESKESE